MTGRAFGDAECDDVVETARGRLDSHEARGNSRRPATDSIGAARRKSTSPCTAEEGVVAIDEARDVVPFRVVVLHEHCVIGDDLLLPRHACRPSPWVPEVAIEHVNIGEKW